MKKRSRPKAPFIAVLPASLLMACSSTSLPGNPPRPDPTTTPASTTTQEIGDTISKNPPDPDANSKTGPPRMETSYGKRTQATDGKCYVEVVVNPPYQQPVNCYAVIEPAPAGDKWCRVESADNPRNKIPVDCASPDLRPIISKNPPPFRHYPKKTYNPPAKP